MAPWCGRTCLAVALGSLAIATAPTAASAQAPACQEATITRPAVADSWIDELGPLNNRGTDAILNVEANVASGNSRALVRFTLPTVPDGCVVESARLRLFASSGSEGSRLEALRAAGAWSENAVTWDNQPATTGAAAVAWSRDGYIQWNVLSHVRAMLDGAGNDGFVIRDLAEGGDGAGHGFHSREKGEDMPQLVLQLAAPATGEPAPPAPPTPAAARCGQLVKQSIRLTNDLSECPGDGLVIGAPRIVIDLDGHTIDGVGLGTGVRNDGFPAVTVTGGTVQEFDYGVELLSETKLNVVQGLTLQRNQLAGIELFDAREGNEIRSNAVHDNGAGIALVSGTNGALVAGNAMTGNGGAGLLIRDATDNRLEDNSVSGGGDLGVGLERSSRNTLVGISSAGNSDGGIELTAGSHDNRVERSIVSESGDTGILVSESDRNVLIANTAHGMSDSGITLNTANDGVVRANDVRFNPGGLQMDGSSRNLVEANDASDTTGIGIELGGGSYDNDIVRNTTRGNAAQGIYVGDEALVEPGNLLDGNVAGANSADGIAVAKGGHTLARNVARHNGGWGILAAPDNIDGGGNRAGGNVQLGQCSGIGCDGDSAPPDTAIDDEPDDPTNLTSASFELEGIDDATPASELRFECRLDGGDFAECSSPQEYAGLSPGSHTFEARAVDGADADPTPASYTWTVDTDAPETAIDSGPADTATNAATFAFSADEPDPSFECSLDGAAFEECESPLEYAGLTAGPHRFEVVATDAAGNADPTPAGRSWTVDDTPPESSVDSGPDETTTSTSANFVFSASEASTFACALDGAAFTPCSSPREYTGLALGLHRFEVRATDAAGNVEREPATHAWTVKEPPDTTPPETTIGSRPAATTVSRSASFTFSSSEPGSTFECSLDGAAFAGCESPREYTDLALGGHRFEVQATDAAGNADPTPAAYAWTVSPPPTDCGPVRTLGAQADSWIDQSATGSNMGGDSVLKVQSKARANFRALVRFALPTNVPLGCVVASATLRLHAGSARTGRTLQALAVAAPWGERQVTWANQPATTGAAAATSSGTGYREWNVASQVQAMHDSGAAHGFLIRDAVENASAEQQFHSREKGDNPPQLVIRFMPGGG